MLHTRLVGIVGVTAGAFALPAAAHAVVIPPVNSLADTGPDGCNSNPGGCTLRDALRDAKLEEGPNTITFQSGLSGTITLAGGTLHLYNNDPVTIAGPGPDVITISGTGDGVIGGAIDDQVFHIGQFDREPSVTISGVTITKGETAKDEVGGGILLESGSLTLDHVRVTGNAAGFGGGIGSPGYYCETTSLTISNSELSGNYAYFAGGAVASVTQLAIDNSTVAGNTAQGWGGGGIEFGFPFREFGSPCYASNLTVDDSTFSGNTTIFEGPAAYDNAGGALQISKRVTGLDRISDSTFSGNHAARSGGGISFNALPGGSLEVVNSTISGNDSDAGGGMAFRGTLPQPGADTGVHVRNSTVAGNSADTRGGGLDLDLLPGSGVVTVDSSIVAGNQAAADLDRNDAQTAGGFDLAFSLVGSASGDAGVTQSGPNLFGLDPLLGPLASNSGPTQTRMPASGSPAIDAGRNSLGLGADQRGAARLADAPGIANAADGTDIGAVELSVEPSPSQTSPPALPPKQRKCKRKHRKPKRAAEAKKKPKKKCKKKRRKR